MPPILIDGVVLVSSLLKQLTSDKIQFQALRKRCLKFFVNIIALIFKQIMKNDEIISKIRNIVNSGKQGSWTRILLAKKNANLVSYITEHTPLLSDSCYTIGTKIYWVLNGLKEFPKCKTCGKPLTNKNVNAISGYVRQYCSMKCSRSSPESIAKCKHTKLEHFGNENFVNREKAVQTNIERYGAKDIMQTSIGKEHLSNSIKEKYGTNWFTETNEFQEKAKKTWKEKYGEEIENPTQSKEILEKIRRNNLEKYGVENLMQLPETVKKLSEKFQSIYGCKWIFQNKEIQEKIRQSTIDKYGFPYATQNPNIQKKLHQKFILNISKFRKEIHKKYVVDTLMFDSSWEIAYFIWLSDNNVSFVYQPNISFEYIVEDETHYYFPDFIVEGNIVEIKGDHFFDKTTGHMICPWKQPNWTIKDIEKSNQIYRAKQLCMEENNVKILRNSDLKPILQYIEEKYGKNYLQQFKKM